MNINAFISILNDLKLSEAASAYVLGKLADKTLDTFHGMRIRNAEKELGEQLIDALEKSLESLCKKVDWEYDEAAIRDTVYTKYKVYQTLVDKDTLREILEKATKMVVNEDILMKWTHCFLATLSDQEHNILRDYLMFSNLISMDEDNLTINISPPDNLEVYIGGCVNYKLKFFNKNECMIFSKENIKLIGFSANVNIIKINEYETFIILKSIDGEIGEKYFQVVFDSKILKKSPVFKLRGKFSLYENSTRPSISISLPSNKIVNPGGATSYEITYSSPNANIIIDLNESDIELHNFKGDIEVFQLGKNVRVVYLSNIKDTEPNKTSKYVSIASHTARDINNYAMGIPGSEPFLIGEPKKIPISSGGGPSVSISAPSSKTVSQNGEVIYTVTFSNYTHYTLNESDVGICGGSNVSLIKEIVSGPDKDSKLVKLKKIRGPLGSFIGIGIRSGVAINQYGSSRQTPNSVGFRIKE